MSDRANHHFGLVLDCADPQRLAAFWAAALDYVNVGSAGAYVALYPSGSPASAPSARPRPVVTNTATTGS